MIRMGLMSKKAVFPIFLIAGILLPVVASAGALQKITVEEMAKLADVIVVGLVEKKEGAWVDKHIETTIRIQVSEYWKGSLGSTIELTQMGGEVTRPFPIAMHADGAPRFFEGERVILFLEKPKQNRSAAPPPPGAKISEKLTSSMQVLGWAQGKYTIISDPKTGEDKAVCLGMQNVRVVDKREMDNYIQKAKNLIEQPGKVKRAKYIKIQNHSYQLNQSLIEKNELLLGIKGYYTNLEESQADNELIVNHYHNLWRIEHAFRITKSDLQIRPIFHHKKEIIELHILICFMALAICKYMELKTEKSTQTIIKLLKSVTDARIMNTISGEEIILRVKMNSEVKMVVDKLIF